MSSNKEDQRYLDAVKIVDAYEKAARAEQNRASALINMDSNLSILKQVLKAAEKSMEDMTNPGLPGERFETEKTEKVSESQNQNSCSEDIIKTPTLNDPTLTVNIKEDIERNDVYNDAVSFFTGDSTKAKNIQDEMERCFNCSLRARFDFQIRPVNFLSELLPLIDSILDTVDNLLEQLEPFDLVSNICELLDGMKWWCPADLMGLIIAYQGLLQRYYGQMMKIVLSWPFLVGPLIKFIVDQATSLFDQIRRILLAPLDCAAGVLQTMISLKNQVIEAVDETAAFGKTFPQMLKNSGEGYSTSAELGAIDPKWDKTGAQILSSTKNLNLSTGFSFGFEDDLETVFRKKAANKRLERRLRDEIRLQKKKDKKKYQEIQKLYKGWGPSEEIASEEVASEEIQMVEKNLRDIQNNTQIGPLESALFAVNSARSWVNELFANLLLAVKSLNSWVVGSIGLSIKISGYILMILDLIKVVQIIMQLSQMKNFNLSELCKMQKENPDKLREIFDKMLGFSVGENRKAIEDYRKQMALLDSDPANSSCSPLV